MIDEVMERADLAAAGLGVVEFRANLSALLDGLEGDRPVVVNVRNKPTAVLLALAAYREMREEAFAYRLLQIAEEAKYEEKLTFEEAKADILQARDDRRHAVEQAEAADAPRFC